MKLTAITLTKGAKKLQRFAMLPYVNGRAILPDTLLNKYLKELGVERGQTFSIG